MKVSLVMTVYNGEEYVEEAINGILAQTYSDLEIIIVNNGSTDSTEKILNNIYDKRVKIIHLAINQGIANALNLAILQAKGDWIAIHDADDISLPYRIQEQVDYLRGNSNLVAVGSFIEYILGNRITGFELMQVRNMERYKNSIITWDQIKEELLKFCPITHGSLLMSKEAYIKAGGYNPKYKVACDYDLFTRLADIGPIENVPKVLYKYRTSLNSSSNSNMTKTSTEFLLASTDYIRRHCFSNKTASPNIIIYGTKRGCSIFKNLMEKERNFNVSEMMSYYEEKKLEKAYSNYRAGKIDAFIILTNAQETKKIISFLNKKGLKINKDFFTLWSTL